MSADLVEGACVRIPVIGSGIEHGMIEKTPAFADAIAAALDRIAARVRERASEQAAS